MSFFHGGIPGLGKGDLILPPSRSGALWRALGVSRRTTTDVYVTRRKRIAFEYAASYRFFGPGDLYRVEPLGPVCADRAAKHRSSFAVDSARVVEVLCRGLTPRDVNPAFEAAVAAAYITSLAEGELIEGAGFQW